MPEHVVITGAARGIGAEMLARLAQAGADVTGIIRGADHPATPARWITADVTDPASLTAAASAIPAPVDLLVCNAGVYLDRGLGVDDHIADAWAQSFAVNVEGVFNTVQAFLPALAQSRAGRIAIVSSQMGSSERAAGQSYAYRASKAAAINLGRNLAIDLAPRGIAVGIYHPGWVRTGMGGPDAPLDTATSAAGLIRRFDALSLATTGLFENYLGEAYPY